MHYTANDIKDLDRVRRLKLINSVSGIKPANLIGTKNRKGQLNLAIFSSVIHLGSNPALLGCIVRPTGEVPRHTYANIMAEKEYTINHIGTPFVENAHYTSAKFDGDVSEFERCQFTPEYINNFKAPFVKESKLKMGLRLVETIPITINDTLMLVGEIQHILVDDIVFGTDDDLDLSLINSAGVSGLNTYYELKKIARYPYARVPEVPNFTSD